MENKNKIGNNKNKYVSSSDDEDLDMNVNNNESKEIEITELTAEQRELLNKCFKKSYERFMDIFKGEKRFINGFGCALCCEWFLTQKPSVSLDVNGVLGVAQICSSCYSCFKNHVNQQDTLELF